MIKKFTKAFLLALLFNGTIFAQWVIQGPPTTAKLTALYFFNSTTGYASGAFSPMYKTTDGGLSWNSVGSYPAADIDFFDATVGYAAATGGSASLKKTIDGGNTWSNLTAPNSSSMWGTFATSQDVVYFIATDNKVHKSINGGISFTSINLVNSNYPTDIVFTHPDTGYISTQNGKIFKTTNAGSSWLEIYSVPATWLNNIHFVDSRNGYIAGSAGKIFKTTDAGLTWTQIVAGSPAILFAIRFSDVNHGLAAGTGGVILKTIDGGLNWTSEPTNSNSFIYALYFTDSGSVVAVGDSGLVLTNTNVWTDVHEIKNNFVSTIFPNPFSESAAIRLGNISYKTNIKLTIFNTAGSILREQMFASTEKMIFSKENLLAGIYFYKLDVDGNYFTGKMMIY